MTKILSQGKFQAQILGISKIEMISLLWVKILCIFLLNLESPKCIKLNFRYIFLDCLFASLRRVIFFKRVQEPPPRNRPKPSAPSAPSVAEAEVPEEAGLTNAADATKTGTTEPPKGASDWTCQECHNVNWARRRECNKCGLPRPKRTKAEDQSLSIGGNVCVVSVPDAFRFSGELLGGIRGELQLKSVRL